MTAPLTWLGFVVQRKDAGSSVVDVGDANPPANRAVIGDAPEQQVAIVGLPGATETACRIPRIRRTTQVSVSVSMQNAEIARRQFTLRPTDSATGEVIYVPKESGRLDGRFEIAGLVSCRRFVSVYAQRPGVGSHPVLVINGAPQQRSA